MLPPIQKSLVFDNVASYIVFELLKNVESWCAISTISANDGLQSFRATRIKHPAASVLPPIRATIISGEDLVTIRISDQGQFIDNSHLTPLTTRCPQAAVY